MSKQIIHAGTPKCHSDVMDFPAWVGCLLEDITIAWLAYLAEQEATNGNSKFAALYTGQSACKEVCNTLQSLSSSDATGLGELREYGNQLSSLADCLASVIPSEHSGTLAAKKLASMPVGKRLSDVRRTRNAVPTLELLHSPLGSKQSTQAQLADMDVATCSTFLVLQYPEGCCCKFCWEDASSEDMMKQHIACAKHTLKAKEALQFSVQLYLRSCSQPFEKVSKACANTFLSGPVLYQLAFLQADCKFVSIIAHKRQMDTALPHQVTQGTAKKPDDEKLVDNATRMEAAARDSIAHKSGKKHKMQVVKLAEQDGTQAAQQNMPCKDSAEQKGKSVQHEATLPGNAAAPAETTEEGKPPDQPANSAKPSTESDIEKPNVPPWMLRDNPVMKLRRKKQPAEQPTEPMKAPTRSQQVLPNTKTSSAHTTWCKVCNTEVSPLLCSHSSTT